MRPIQCSDQAEEGTKLPVTAPLLRFSRAGPMAVGCDGIFMEVHENPPRALSDAANQVSLKDLPKHLRMLKAIHAAVSGRGD